MRSPSFLSADIPLSSYYSFAQLTEMLVFERGSSMCEIQLGVWVRYLDLYG